MNVYLVSMYFEDEDSTAVVGVFDTKPLALLACLSEDHCITELLLNEDLNDVPAGTKPQYFPMEAIAS